jgi:hypothetical protein
MLSCDGLVLRIGIKNDVKNSEGNEKRLKISKNTRHSLDCFELSSCIKESSIIVYEEHATHCSSKT